MDKFKLMLKPFRRLNWTVILWIVGVVTFAQVLLFYHYNQLFTDVTAPPPKKTTNTNAVQAQQKAIAREISQLKSKYTFVTESADDEYVAYLDSNSVLHIMNLQTHQQSRPANCPYKVEYVEWIQDERVFVGEQVEPGDLELKTVDATTGQQTIVTRFQGLSADAAFAQIAFSTLTNDIYVLINTSSTSAIWHIGTMSHLTQVAIGDRFIKKIALSQTGDKLYFEDYLNGSYNVLYFDSNFVAHRVQLNAALVDLVGNTLYYGDINSSGLVTSVYKYTDSGQSSLVSTLQKPTASDDIDITSSGAVDVTS